MPLTYKQKIGQIGENIAVKHLKKRGFKILDRNYRKKWGEIDIIAESNESASILQSIFKPKRVLHFIEIKSQNVSGETLTARGLSSGQINVSYETFIPEENLHFWKRKRLSRAIRTYLLEKRIPYNTEWQIDIMAIFINLKDKKAKIRFTDNIII